VETSDATAEDRSHKKKIKTLSIELCGNILDSSISKAFLQENVNKVELNGTILELLITVSEEALGS